MTTISVDRLRAGMVLETPAVGARGNILIGAGSELTEGLIGALKKRGVAEVEVVDPVKGETPVPQKLLKQSERELAPRFQKVDLEHPFARQVFEFAVRDHAQKRMLQANNE